MLGQFQGWQLVILIVVVLLLFGAKRLPDAARSVGRSMRIFKSEVKSMNDDDRPASETDRAERAGPVHRDPEALDGRVLGTGTQARPDVASDARPAHPVSKDASSER